VNPFATFIKVFISFFKKLEMGLVKEYENLKDFSTKENISYENLLDSFRQNNQKSCPFGKKVRNSFP
jgi:hypothetical protein